MSARPEIIAPVMPDKLPTKLMSPMPAAAAVSESTRPLAIFPRKVDFSCFGDHPDLESRLTF